MSRRPGRSRRMPTGGGWSPKSIGGLVLWLDNSLITLNGSTVSAWPDLSGSGNHFTQSNASLQPNYIASETDFPAAQPAVKFNVANSRLVAGGSFSIQWAAIVAVTPEAAFSAFRGLLTSTLTANGFALTGDSGTANWRTADVAWLGDNIFANGVDTDAALGVANVPKLFEVTFAAPTSRVWQVGGDRDVVARQWNDSVGLVIATTSIPDNNNRTALLAYCRSRGLIP